MARIGIMNKQINEVSIKLLPEREKRDYILRMIMFIIVMFFIILNFFVVFLPRLNLINEANNVRRDNYTLESKSYNLYDLFNQIDVEFSSNGKMVKLFNIPKNNDVSKIEYNQVDVYVVTEDIKEVLAPFQFSYLVNIKFDGAANTFVLDMQFLTYSDVVDFQNVLSEMEYFSDVRMVSRIDGAVSEGPPRQYVIFSVILDSATSPKVGDLRD